MSNMIETIAKALRKNATGKEDGWAYEESNAIAALNALREPTKEMLEAGYWGHGGSLYTQWQSMIDEALGQKQPEEDDEDSG